MTNPIAETSQLWRALFSPPPINSVEDTGLSPLWLQDLALKILYSQGYMSGFQDRRADRPAVCRRDRSDPGSAEA